MLMTSLMVITDVPNEYGLMVQCECREVIIAETKTVQGAAQKDQANPAATAGTQNTGTVQAQPVNVGTIGSHQWSPSMDIGLSSGGAAYVPVGGGPYTGGGF